MCTNIWRSEDNPQEPSTLLFSCLLIVSSEGCIDRVRERAACRSELSLHLHMGSRLASQGLYPLSYLFFFFHLFSDKVSAGLKLTKSAGLAVRTESPPQCWDYKHMLALLLLYLSPEDQTEVLTFA